MGFMLHSLERLGQSRRERFVTGYLYDCKHEHCTVLFRISVFVE